MLTVCMQCKMVAVLFAALALLMIVAQMSQNVSVSDYVHLVFAITEVVSLFLQSKNIMLQDAVGQVNVACRCLQRHRTDEAYNLFYENCLNDSNLLSNQPCLHRARRPPRRIDSDSEPHVFETPLEYYRKINFEVIDVVVNELNRRFDQPSLQIPLAIERLILEAANWDVPGSLQITVNC